MLCYLCGKSIERDATDDHVPPKQIWSRELREKIAFTNLKTLPTHAACNSAYSLDEEYAIQALASAAYSRSQTARSVVQHSFGKVAAGKGVGLHRRIFDGISNQTGGIYLPAGKVVMNVEGARITRVLWKIVRGLWFLEYSTILRDDTKCAIDILEPEDPTKVFQFQEFYDIVRSQPERGAYPGIFAYKHLVAREDEGTTYGWAMLMWNSVIAYCTHVERAAPPSVPIAAEPPAA